MEREVKKILIIDDSTYFRGLKESYLRRRTCRMLQAKNGEEGLHVLVSENPDLIIMDLTMPLVNGAECCRVIKGHPDYRHIPVVMLANAWDKNAKALSQEAGCDVYLEKPVNRQMLYSTIKRFLKIEERRHTRVPAFSKATIRSGKVSYSGTVSNIGPGGLFVRADDHFPKGTAVTVAFELRGIGGLSEMEGTVAWIAGEEEITAGLEPGMGIRFSDLSPEIRSAIKGMLL